MQSAGARAAALEIGSIVNGCTVLAFHKGLPALSWPDDQVDFIRARWATGDTSYVITKDLNVAFGTERTRQSVIGKIHRLKLAKRDRPAPRKSVKHRPQPVQPRLVVVRSRDDFQPLREDGATIALLGLRAGMCRYPIGDPKAADFCFCAHPVAGDGSMCATHHALCHQPIRFELRAPRGVR